MNHLMDKFSKASLDTEFGSGMPPSGPAFAMTAGRVCCVMHTEPMQVINLLDVLYEQLSIDGRVWLRQLNRGRCTVCNKII
jgi:hypothetical protein